MRKPGNIFISSALLAGHTSSGDAIFTAAQADKKSNIAALDSFETKMIAEKGSLYGLPILMNYAVMTEFSLDKNSGQYKAPFNSIYNDALVFTGKDRETNWLPAPNDTIYMVMSLYWPKTEAPSILPAGAGSWNPPGILLAN